jgi:hypothetical protein
VSANACWTDHVLGIASVLEGREDDGNVPVLPEGSGDGRRGLRWKIGVEQESGVVCAPQDEIFNSKVRDATITRVSHGSSSGSALLSSDLHCIRTEMLADSVGMEAFCFLCCVLFLFWTTSDTKGGVKIFYQKKVDACPH